MLSQHKILNHVSIRKAEAFPRKTLYKMKGEGKETWLKLVKGLWRKLEAPLVYLTFKSYYIC